MAVKVRKDGRQRFVLELWFRTEADPKRLSRVMRILKNWMNELYRALPDTSFGSRYVKVWAWGNILLDPGDSPEKAHGRLLAKLRRVDPQIGIVSRWGEFVDQWLYTFEDAPPGLPKRDSEGIPAP